MSDNNLPTHDAAENPKKQPKRYGLYARLNVSEKGINFFIGAIVVLLVAAVVVGVFL